MMRHFFCISTLIFAGPVFAQTVSNPEMPDGCALHGENGFVRLVVCSDPNASEETLVDAGKSACGEDLPCGAWIWSDAALLPQVAPSNHDGLTQEQITSSRGVWVAENSSFVSIEQVK
ncbi:MAG: hypothetical protein AAF066_09765 [Pseudomonadota bacterium]